MSEICRGAVASAMLLVTILLALPGEGCKKDDASPDDAASSQTDGTGEKGDARASDRDAAAPSNAKERLAAVRVASLFERITDSFAEPGFTRDIDGNVALLGATYADFVFRGFFPGKWPAPNSCSELEAYPEAKQACDSSGYSYGNLQSAIVKLKAARSGVIFCGAVPIQVIARQLVWDPETARPMVYPQTWNLALDPSKWSLSTTKKDFQCSWAKSQGLLAQSFDCAKYDPAQVESYFPDLTNPDYSSYLLDVMERQVKAGAEALWLDSLFAQVKLLATLTGSNNHLSVQQSYQAARSLIQIMHHYGTPGDGYLYLGSSCPNAESVEVPGETPPVFDFCTISPTSAEVSSRQLDQAKTAEKVAAARKVYPDIPIFAFMEWGNGPDMPLYQFSQVLTKEQQQSFLRTADAFYQTQQVVFVYPIHGGTMGSTATRLSFGKSGVYDSQAPEFATYETIRSLATAKHGAP